MWVEMTVIASNMVGLVFSVSVAYSVSYKLTCEIPFQMSVLSYLELVIEVTSIAGTRALI